MKVLLCHNYYQQQGGEDLSFEDESQLLKSRGHSVIEYTLSNDQIPRHSNWELLRKTIWNSETHRDLRELLARERPDVMHCTNTFPLISPSAYYAAHKEGVAVVQALRNYRLMCPGAVLMRDGRACEDCVGKRFAWPSIVHGCYRRSRAASAAAASMSTMHRMLGTWSSKVDLFFTLTNFAREKFIEFGIPAERISVKPNFVPNDLGLGTAQGGYVVYVGRLSEEKGMATLIDAWKRIEADVQLKIVGDGPLRQLVEDATGYDKRIEWMGRRSTEEVAQIIGDADGLILPSVCYETFGRTIVEAYCRGTPVIASRLGAMAELVIDQETGLQFTAGDAEDLAAKVVQLLESKEQRKLMRRNARQQFEKRYTPDANYRFLCDIYCQAIANRKRKLAIPSESCVDDSDTFAASEEVRVPETLLDVRP